MKLEYKDKEGWDKIVKVNTDKEKDPMGYGLAIIRYAENWANLMEKKMSEGKKLQDIWKKASHDADDEGVTGFMYGMAVSILSETWKYGEELRKLHNLDTQIGNEGEKANESGGVLNPATMTISLK